MKALITFAIIALLNNPIGGGLPQSQIDEFDSASCNDDQFYIAETAATIGEEEQQEILSDMYQEIPESEIEEFDDMSVVEVKEELDSLDSKYEVGEPFSEEDQALLLYAYNEYGGGNLDSNDSVDDNGVSLETVSYEWKNYSVGSSKTNLGVKTTYSGKLKTYVTASGGKYAADVKVTVNSGKSKIKSLKWKTYHTAYGVLGMSGKTPSLGIVYDGSLSSSAYTNTFTFNKTKDYSSILPVYIKTWGKVFVNTKSGEYNYGTKTYSSWE